MSVTSDYARIRGAFHRVARARRLTVADVELLVAVYELDQAGEQVTYACLYEALACDPTRVRRSVGCLYARGYAAGVGVDGGDRRPGVCTIVSLSDAGRVVAREALDLIHGHEILRVAA
jgi:hypothetical protein